MFRRSIIALDMIALMLSAIWMMYNILKGISTSDLVFSYLYSSVVMAAFILTLFDQWRRN